MTSILSSPRILGFFWETFRASRKRIEEAAIGPRANPARRFAVWALREHTLLKNGDIADLMNISYDQVSNVLSRFNGGRAPMAARIGALSHYVTDDGD